MRLTGFRYLKSQHILVLALLLILASMLFSITALSLLGFYKALNACLGEGEDIVAIYEKKSSTPFTGLVPTYLAQDIRATKGVLVSSPETMVPCFLKEEPIFLRGVIPEEFSKLSPLTIMDGKKLELTDMNSVIVGQSLAKKAGLKPSDIILIQGVLSDRCLELQVKGIYRSNSPMDDEALAPIYVGQWLRGADYDHVTLVRVKIDKTVTGLKEILEELAKASEPGSSEQDEQGPPEQSVIPEVKAYFRIEDLGVEDAQKFMKGYLDRYGITREALLVISMMVFLLSSASVAMASKTLVNQHREEIGILRSVGASKTTVKKDILVKLLLWSLVASAIGILLGVAVLHFVEMGGYWQILSHTVTLQLDPIIIVADFILVSLLVALSILGLDLEWKATSSSS